MKPALNDRVKIRNTFVGFARAVSGMDETALVELESATIAQRWAGWVPFNEIELAPLPPKEPSMEG